MTGGAVIWRGVLAVIVALVLLTFTVVHPPLTSPLFWLSLPTCYFLGVGAARTFLGGDDER